MNCRGNRNYLMLGRKIEITRVRSEPKLKKKSLPLELVK